MKKHICHVGREHVCVSIIGIHVVEEVVDVREVVVIAPIEQGSQF
jgi:hypothetical protein